jgi:hypothetical protein
LPAERRAAFDKLGGDARLAAAVREEMRRTGRHPSPPGAQLQLVVTAFRLRSTASSVWLGAMAGADMLDVTVRVVDQGREVRRFDTGAGTIVGGLIRPGAEGRFERVVQTTAERIVAGL